jgi:hypothetical protein
MGRFLRQKWLQIVLLSPVVIIVNVVSPFSRHRWVGIAALLIAALILLERRKSSV